MLSTGSLDSILGLKFMKKSIPRGIENYIVFEVDFLSLLAPFWGPKWSQYRLTFCYTFENQSTFPSKTLPGPLQGAPGGSKTAPGGSKTLKSGLFLRMSRTKSPLLGKSGHFVRDILKNHQLKMTAEAYHSLGFF